MTDDLTAAVARLRESASSDEHFASIKAWAPGRDSLLQTASDKRTVCAALEQAQQENARLRRSAAGWEADALIYAQSHGCQQEMTENTKTLARTLARALDAVKNHARWVLPGGAETLLASPAIQALLKDDA